MPEITHRNLTGEAINITKSLIISIRYSIHVAIMYRFALRVLQSQCQRDNRVATHLLVSV